jgi:hypothetical protein
MSAQPPSDETPDAGSNDEEPTEEPTEEEGALEAYDLDGDGKISPVEEARAALGVADAKLEQVAEEGGVKGKIADAAHQILDRFDND